MKDWIGNSKSTFSTLGANNHSEKDRVENDFYATHPIAARFLMELEELSLNIWECACGRGHLSEEFVRGGVQRKEYRFNRPWVWYRWSGLLKADRSI